MSDPWTAPAAQPTAPQGGPVRALVVINVLLALLYSLYGTFLLLGGGLFSSNVSVMGRPSGAPSRDLLFCFAGLTYGVALVLLVAAVGLQRRRPWGRFLTLVLGALAAVVTLLSLRQMALLGIALNGIYSTEVFIILLNPTRAAEFGSAASPGPST